MDKMDLEKIGYFLYMQQMEEEQKAQEEQQESDGEANADP